VKNAPTYPRAGNRRSILITELHRDSQDTQDLRADDE
jgi:hypothetical protein